MICDTSDNVRILVELTLSNMALLWDIAALDAAGTHAMTFDEITETLGPREDPDALACVTLLFDTVVRRIGASDPDATITTTLRDVADHPAYPSRLFPEAHDHSALPI